MAIKLRKIQKQLPGKPDISKWYLTQSKTGTTGLKEIAREISGRSSLSTGDIQSVLSNLVEIMPLFLKAGQSIKLDGFGIFRLTVSSEGLEKEDDLKAHHVKGVKLVFLPDIELKNSLKNLSFEVVP